MIRVIPRLIDFKIGFQSSICLRLIRSVGKRTSDDAMLICVLLGSSAFMSKSCSLPFVLVGTRKPEVATIPSNPTADSAKEIQLIGLETVS